MFSRWMPPYPRSKAAPTPRAVLVGLILLVGWLLWYVAQHAVGALAAGACVALVALGGALGGRVLDRRLGCRARERTGEDIGTFARALDRRAPSFDPWIVRAVWDALTSWTVLGGGGHLPLHPSDVIADLGCVDEDLEDVLDEAAARAGRRLDDMRANPYYGRVSTVGDLVAFISHQPRETAA